MQEISRVVSNDGKSFLEQARECIFLIRVARATMLKEQAKRGVTPSKRADGYVPTSWYRIH